MPLIKAGAFVDDPWTHLADDDALPESGPVFVSYERWLRDHATLATREAPVGIRLASDQPAELVEGDLGRLAAVAVTFPSFTDGRSYSTARVLRQHMSFSGEIRAVGNVLRDQLAFMGRCGIDAWEVPADRASEEWLAAFTEFAVAYQRAADPETTVAARRGAMQR